MQAPVQSTRASPEMTPRERFLNACRRELVDRPPVWMMRQAGRYLPSYQAVRQTKTTLEMMKDPETACEITLQPVNELGVDAAILYSDILMVPEAMGLRLEIGPETGPRFTDPVKDRKDVERLTTKEVVSRLPFVFRAIELLKKRLPRNFPLIGFAGAPFTVGTYMVEGEGDPDGYGLKTLAYEDRESFNLLMEKIAEATVMYLKGQVAAGADVIQLFDTHAGALSVADYRWMAFPYEQSILGEIRKLGVPTILYVRTGCHLFERMLEVGADVLSIDWRLPLARAKTLSGGKVAIQGNLDPARLYAPIPEIERAVEEMVGEWGKGPGYLINLGHGIMKDVPVAHAKAFVEAAKKFGPRTTR